MALRAYRSDNAFDGDRQLPNGVLVIVEGCSIMGVEPAGHAPPDDCDVQHFPGATILPGLIDAHVHLCGDGGPRALDQLDELSEEQLDAAIEQSLRTQLAAGVTAVRDLGDRIWTVVDRHRQRADGPTVVGSGPPITSPGGHCANMGGETAGADALRRAVRERAEHRVDVVKVMTSGGIMTPTTDLTACQFTLDELRVVVDEAHALGLPVTAHAHPVAAVEQSVDAGVDGIEHCTCMTGSGVRTPPDLADRIAAAGIVVCPTFGTLPGAKPPPRTLAAMERYGLNWGDRIKQVAVLRRAGVRLISGSDGGINPAKRHGILPYALANLVKTGVSAAAALASATGEAADVCGIADRTGRLRPGLDADLLIVDGDPCTDISAVTQVRAVVSRGRPVSSPG